VFYLPALILLLGIVISSLGAPDPARRNFRLGFLVAAVSLSNFLFLIFPYSHEEKYPPLAFAREMNATWPSRTVIYYETANSDTRFFKYFSPATNWRMLDTTRLEALDNELREFYDNGVPTWLDHSAMDRLSSTSGGTLWLYRHAQKESLRKLKDTAFKIRFIQVAP
jgi:hypothetical protein